MARLGSGANRQPPANISKNHGPRTIFIPTFVGGAKETYSLIITRPCRDRVKVRTPLPGRVARR